MAEYQMAVAVNYNITGAVCSEYPVTDLLKRVPEIALDLVTKMEDIFIFLDFKILLMIDNATAKNHLQCRYQYRYRQLHYRKKSHAFSV